ncbi:hypothetical protein B5X24_HaOG201767 [Helicoverpa armigera]|nr:hypothetical protein B5X24_HaOG201767 [Helicoverpa armigera]
MLTLVEIESVEIFFKLVRCLFVVLNGWGVIYSVCLCNYEVGNSYTDLHEVYKLVAIRVLYYTMSNNIWLIKQAIVNERLSILSIAVGKLRHNLTILGGPGVDAHVRHECGEAVLHARFLINEGALVTATADDQLHLWTFRQKSPQRLHSLKFQRERITCLHLPLASKWVHVGTERGNVHVVNIETFALSGYVINWNKAIEVAV